MDGMLDMRTALDLEVLYPKSSPSTANFFPITSNIVLADKDVMVSSELESFQPMAASRVVRRWSFHLFVIRSLLAVFTRFVQASNW
jgi:hypothetical protein